MTRSGRASAGLRRLAGLVRQGGPLLLFGCIFSVAINDAPVTAGFFRPEEVPAAVVEAAAEGDLALAVRILYEDERTAWLWAPHGWILDSDLQAVARGGRESLFVFVDERARCCRGHFREAAARAEPGPLADFNRELVRLYRADLAAGRADLCARNFRGPAVPKSEVLRFGLTDPRLLANYLAETQALRAVWLSGRDGGAGFEPVSPEVLWFLTDFDPEARAAEAAAGDYEEVPLDEMSPELSQAVCRYAIAFFSALDRLGDRHAASYWLERFAP